MPIVRKVIQVGTSKAVTLPKSWIELQEKKKGKKIEAVEMEVNNVLTLAAIFAEEKQKTK